MPSCDVAIIGAGPAGSAAARLLAGWGHRVVLVHNEAGMAATLGESIPPSCRKLFAAIGVLERVDAHGFLRSTGNTVWWAADEPRVEHFAGDLGYQVERVAFDALLREHARAAGAELRAVAARDARLESDGVCIALADQSELRAVFVLDCSGRAGVIARRGWRIDLREQPRTVALVGVWTRPDGWPDVEATHTLVESYADGWAWSVPITPHSRYVTAMVDPQRTELARGRPAVDVYRAELRKARRLNALVERGTLERGPWGCDASVYVARRYADRSILLVGDAASFIDPLSSYGVKKALASAWVAAVAVHTALRTSSITAAALEFFSAREAEVAAALIEQTRSYFGEGASRHVNPFWSDRATPVDLPGAAEPDVRMLREDERVQRAFASLKEKASIHLRRGTSLHVEPRPVIRGHQIVLEERLFSATLPGGARFLRDVDLAGVLALAPACTQVPELFETYCHRYPPVALPDFLGALSVMLAFGLLDHCPATSG